MTGTTKTTTNRRGRKRSNRDLLGGVAYDRPDGKPGAFRCTMEEQRQLVHLSPRGIMRSGIAALHLSLSPMHDDGGPRLTAGLHMALAAATTTSTLPPPHPDRKLPRKETEHEQALHEQVMMLRMQEYDLIMAISELTRAAA